MSEVKAATTKSSIANRSFFLNENVTAKSLEDIILGIHEINRLDDEQGENKTKYERKPIKIIVDSYGGECYSGMALVNSIIASTTDVHTYCYGKSMSMALTIFTVGHRRFASKNATFMQHQLSGGTYGKLRDMIEDTEQRVILQDMMDNVLIEGSKIERSKLMDLRDRKKDWYFTGEEALNLGVVDELIIRRLKGA